MTRPDGFQWISGPGGVKRAVKPVEPIEQWLSVQGVATRLGVSKMSIYREIERGRLKGYRFGKQIRVKPADLESYLRGAVAYPVREEGTA